MANEPEEKPIQHPDARCGFCPACKHIAATQRIVFAHSAPAGPGITDREAQLWNITLRENPCEYPLVIIYLQNPPRTLIGRVSHIQDGGTAVDTMEGLVVVADEKNVQPWTPERCLEGINYQHLAAALANLPATWYPQLFETIVRAINGKDVFVPFGASRTAFRIECEINEAQLHSNKTTDFVLARMWLYSQEMKDAIALLKVMDDDAAAFELAGTLICKIDNGK